MNTNINNIDYSELISSYLSGELNSSQISELEKWVKSSPDNKETFLTYKNIWVSSNINKNNNINVTDELNKLNIKLNLSNKKSQKKLQFFLKIAAVITFIFASIISINFYLTNKNTVIYTAQNSIVEQTLIDGSVISLNNNTSLKFYKNISKIRKAKLKGSAFFKIKHNDKIPFVIETQNIKVKVLGTSFTVDSRTNNKEITVIVKTGKVLVTANNEKVIIIAGEKAIFSKENNKLYKKQNTDINYLSWKTKIIEFNNTNLAEVVKTINKTYNKQIVIDKNTDFSNYKLTAKFNKKSFKSVLNIIKETLDIETKKDGNKLIIFSNN